MDWLKISDDQTLGLLAVRRKLEERGALREASTVEWFGLRRGPADDGRALSTLICRFREKTDESETKTRGGAGLLTGLGERLKSLVEGPSGDAGHASHLAPVPVPVRAKDAGSRRSS